MRKILKKIVNTILFILFAGVLFILLNSLFLGISEPIREVMLYVTQREYDVPLLSRVGYCNMTVALSSIASIILTFLIFRTLNKQLPVKRDFFYLQDLIRSKSPRAPAASLDDLVVKMAGTVDDETRSIAKKVLATNLKKVTKLLDGELDSNKTAVIVGDWGAGKTTMMMLALEKINSMDNHENERYYIYELATFYIGGLDKLKNAVLKALKNTLKDQGIKTGPDVRKIIFNLQKDHLKGISAILRDMQELSITSELINSLNKKYDKKRKNFEIDIIIDDIDRLLPEAMLEMVSFLAVLSQLKFVRLIVPIDLNAANKQISESMKYQPELFLAKYLPEQSSVEIKSTYHIASQIIMSKLKALRVGDGKIDLEPGLAAVLFVMIDKKVRAKSKEWSYSFKWNTLYGEEQPPELNDQLTKSLYSRYQIEHRELSNKPLYLSHISDGRTFRTYLTTTTLNDGTTKIKDVFSDEYYEKCASWVSIFARHCWGFLGISIREVVDELAQLDGLELHSKDGKALQFSEVFNTLSGSELIKVASDIDDRSKK